MTQNNCGAKDVGMKAVLLDPLKLHPDVAPRIDALAHLERLLWFDQR